MIQLLERKAKRLFGTDGVRGRVNQFPMTVETALALGRAAAAVFRRHQGKHRVLLGKDTRLSGYLFENSLIAGLCSMGVDTLMVGPLPTPAVAYLTRAYRADAGIMISASHNPYYDNGIKFFSRNGFKLDDRVEADIEQMIFEGSYDGLLPADHELGKNTKIDDAQGRYIEFVKSTFPRHLTLSQFSIALDCAHGATYRVAPHVFEELGAHVSALNVRPDGLNINHNCGALFPEHVARATVKGGADIGIAFDGDGDRVIMADEKGGVIDGDVLLAICAYDLKVRGLLRGNGVVGTVMTNLGVIHSLEAKGIQVVTASVGDRNVLQAMLDRRLVLGGEQSGHIILLNLNTSGDGLLAALQVLRIMEESGKLLSELAALVTHYPQELVNVRVTMKPNLDEIPLIRQAIHDAEESLGGAGRVVVRYSGTEPVCRVMVEGETESEVKRLAGQVAAAIAEQIGA